MDLNNYEMFQNNKAITTVCHPQVKKYKETERELDKFL